MRERRNDRENNGDLANERLLKEALGEYAGQDLRELGQNSDNDMAQPGARLHGRMKRTFWYYGGGRKKMFAIGGVCAASAALMLTAGIWSVQSGQRQDHRNSGDIAQAESKLQDTDNTQYEVYIDHYGEEAAVPYASVQNQSWADGVLPEGVSALTEAEWSGLSAQTDTETAIRNSNYKNFGYLCADCRGRIYYSDLTERAVYMSNEDGSERTKLTDGAGNYLQERDGNLYYTALDEGGVIMRLNIATGEKTVIMDEPHGEFILTDAGLLINAESGVWLLGYENGEAQRIEAMSDKEWSPALFTASEEMLIFNAVKEADINYYLQGYLLCYDRNEENVLYLGQVMTRPLLAGDYLIAVKGESFRQASLHVMDMAAGTDTDLGVWPYDGFVSDGEALYYTRGGMLCRFQDGKSEELMNLHDQESELMGQAPDRYLYLAGDYLYWLSERQVVEDQKVVEIFYEWHSVEVAE